MTWLCFVLLTVGLQTTDIEIFLFNPSSGQPVPDCEVSIEYQVDGRTVTKPCPNTDQQGRAVATIPTGVRFVAIDVFHSDYGSRTYQRDVSPQLVLPIERNFTTRPPSGYGDCCGGYAAGPAYSETCMVEIDGRYYPWPPATYYPSYPAPVYYYYYHSPPRRFRWFRR